jgi:hypothetical protein
MFLLTKVNIWCLVALPQSSLVDFGGFTMWIWASRKGGYRSKLTVMSTES